MISPNCFTLLFPTFLLTEALKWGHKRRYSCLTLCSCFPLASKFLRNGWTPYLCTSKTELDLCAKLLYVHFLQADPLGSFLGTPQCFKRWEELWEEPLSSHAEMPFYDTGKRNRMVIPTTWTLAKLLLRVWIALSEESGFCTNFLVFFDESHYYPYDFSVRKRAFSPPFEVCLCLLCFLSVNSLEKCIAFGQFMQSLLKCSLHFPDGLITNWFNILCTYIKILKDLTDSCAWMRWSRTEDYQIQS